MLQNSSGETQSVTNSLPHHTAAAPERVQSFRMVSRIRQNYKEDCEALVNKQINLELHASYVYMSLV